MRGGISLFDIQKKAASFTKGRQLDAITGVIIHTGLNDSGEEVTYSAGNSTGYVLEVDCPTGSQIIANGILASLKLRGFRYQPFEADSALIDPACEIGDNITANGVQSIIFSRDSVFGRLMRSTVSAPYDEEVDHEFTYEPRTQREFKRESAYARSRITQTENEISFEVTRATSAEGELSSRISLTSTEIKAEVTRASAAEGTLAGRISINADAITSEVTRAKNAEGSLGTRIDQRLDSITLSVSSASGSSTFTIKDGSTTLDTKTLDLTVKAVNITGKLTVGQLADGSVVTSSKTETEYYLSTSSSSATGGSWSTTVPTWASGKYIWTRQKTTDTRNDSTTSVTYSPQNGAYDKNLTTALSTASTAVSDAGTANTNALSATKRTSVIYCSTSGGSAPTAPTAWVTNATGNQNVWTLVRPEYNSSYPALYIAQQSETVGGTYSCSTPKIDATTTVIDGAHIITGTIDASKISVDNLQAISATLAGWTLNVTSIRKTVDDYRVALIAPENPSGTDYAFYVQGKNNSSWRNMWYVLYNGKMYARDADIAGKVTATSGTIGGVSIENGVLTGIQAVNIAGKTITASEIAADTITHSEVAYNTLTTGCMNSGINTSLGWGDSYGYAVNGTSGASSFYVTSLYIGSNVMRGTYGGSQRALTLQEITATSGKYLVYALKTA